MTTPTRITKHPIRIILTLLVAATSFALALTPAAEEALREGRQVAAEAQRTYIDAFPDQPLWREAIELGQVARRESPNHPEPHRYLAEVYTATKWYGRAWDSWMAYLDVGGRLDSNARRDIALAGNELGYTRYEQGDMEAALRFYRQVTQLVPDNTEAHVWAGRIYLETERPQEAIPYWETVLDIMPGDTRAEYFLGLARDQARWGVQAANSFYDGVRTYEAGDLSSARAHFADAARANSQYAQAWAWRGRTAFEQRDYSSAVNHYRTASELEPGNETYRYFYQESRRRAGS